MNESRSMKHNIVWDASSFALSRLTMLRMNFDDSKLTTEHNSRSKSKDDKTIMVNPIKTLSNSIIFKYSQFSEWRMKKGYRCPQLLLSRSLQLVIWRQTVVYGTLVTSAMTLLLQSVQMIPPRISKNVQSIIYRLQKLKS